MQLSSHNEQLWLWSSGAIAVPSGRNYGLGTPTREPMRRTLGLHDNCQNTILLTRLLGSEPYTFGTLSGPDLTHLESLARHVRSSALPQRLRLLKCLPRGERDRPQARFICC